MSSLATLCIEEGDTGYPYTMQVEYVISVDQNYGADADGRRGIWVEEIEVVQVYAPSETPEHIIKEARRRVESGEER